MIFMYIIFLLSFLDFKSLATRFKSTKLLTTCIFLTCIGILTWQLRNYCILMMSNPTTAPVKIMNSNEIPLAFSFCKYIYDMEFDGNFSAHSHTSINNISVLHGESQMDLLIDGNLVFEKISYIETPLMCKEFVMPEKEKSIIRIERNRLGEDIKNLQLFIHQQGMFYLQEFTVNYPNNYFGLKNINDGHSKIQMTSFDLTKDPEMSCSPLLYQECISNEIVKRFNATVGCTYPIQR